MGRTNHPTVINDSIPLQLYRKDTDRGELTNVVIPVFFMGWENEQILKMTPNASVTAFCVI